MNKKGMGAAGGIIKSMLLLSLNSTDGKIAQAGKKSSKLILAQIINRKLIKIKPLIRSHCVAKKL